MDKENVQFQIEVEEERVIKEVFGRIVGKM